jgi:hypothetical protein
MDVSNLRTGEKIAGISGLALLLVMFIFDWFTYGEGAFSVGGNAWDTMELIRFILFLAALAGIGLAVMSASQTQVNMPVALSALAAGLGGLSVLLVLFRIISPPDFGIGDIADAAGADFNVGRSIGVFLGLIASAGVAYGGWVAMQEEGTSFSAQGDRFQGGGGPPPPSSGGTPPPPPSSGGAPPPSGPAA